MSEVSNYDDQCKACALLKGTSVVVMSRATLTFTFPTQTDPAGPGI